LIVRYGDILWNSTGSGTIGRAAIYRHSDFITAPILIDTHISIVRCDHCLPEYVCRFLSTLHVQKIISDLNVGSTNQLELPRSVIAELKIPLPPLPEQRRIVARIDELFAEIDEGEAALQRARQGLDTWRRALLKAAVTGELTRDWREANRSAETGADLLARIRAEREASHDRRVRSRGPTVVQPFDTSALRELPEDWLWVSVQELFSWSSGDFLPSKSMVPGDIPVFGGNGITGYHDRCLVEDPTIVVGRVGFYCGCVHLTEGRAWITDNAIYAIRMPSGCEPTFLKIILESANIPHLAQGGAQPFVNQKLLNSIYVPLCSTSEQKEISSRYQELAQLFVETDERLEAEKADSAKLRQSVLKAAFEGRLVRQDPADEPASVLLARLHDSNHQTATRRRRARAKEPFSHPSLPALTRQSLDPRVEPAGDD
jgi:type I restriction enzyme S subunit